MAKFIVGGVLVNIIGTPLLISAGCPWIFATCITLLLSAGSGVAIGLFWGID